MRKARNEQRVLGADGTRGFSVVELIVALAIAMIAAVGIYSVFISQEKETSSQRMYGDLQNNLRFALDYMKGEMLLAGFAGNDPDATVGPIFTATGTVFEFEYWDENLDIQKRVPASISGVTNTQSAANYNSNMIKVKYSLENPQTRDDGVVVSELVRTSEVWNTLTPGYDTGLPSSPSPIADKNEEVLARDLLPGGLSFVYYKNDNAPWVAGTDPFEDIRTIRVTLRGGSHRADPYTGSYREMQVSGEVRSRNMGVSDNPKDETPPPIPTGLAVRDPQECGRLLLRWNGVTASDLKGYVIYYGESPGAYVGKKTVVRGPSSGVESYTLTGLSSYNTTYYLAIRAYDNSANMSNLSAEISGNPTPDDSTAFSGPDNHGNDSNINPAVPAPPTFDPATYPNDGEVGLTWTPSVTPGIVGYRLFRHEVADYSDPAVLLADETLLDESSTTYLDQSNDLLGCTEYYYRMAAIHCDSSSFTDGEYGASDYGAVSGMPTDGQPPATPTLLARSGYKRVILNLVNPSRAPAADPDFLYTKIYFNKTTYPSITGGAGLNLTVDSPLIPNSLPDTYPDPGVAMTQLAEGGAINFNHETIESPPGVEPMLDELADYYFLAIAFDTCGNHSDVTDDAKDLGVLCGDCPEPPAAGSACDEVPWAQLPSNFTTAGCEYQIDLDWDPVSDLTTYLDHAGFHVFRREGSTWAAGDPGTDVRLTGGTAWWPSFYPDSTAVMGKQYSYRICSVDCYYDQHWMKSSPADWPDPTDDPRDNINCVTIDDSNPSLDLNSLYLGDFAESSSPPTPVTGDIADQFADVDQDFLHNTVTLFLDNLAAGPMTQNELLDLTWTNTDLVLTDAYVGDGSTTTREVVYDGASQPPVAAGTGFSFTPPKSVDGLDDAVPMTFHFASSGGTVDGDVDMRQEVIDLDVRTTNNSTASSCGYVDSSIFVPLGPNVLNVLQSQPENPTVAWPVPGDAGVNPMDNVIVPGDVDVPVRAIIVDPFPQPGIGQARLFYYIDMGAILSSPPDIADFSLANSIAMNPTGGAGSSVYQTATPIPVSNDSNVWYYVLAVDNNGNFDRSPEIDSGVYQYYQQPSAICDNIPEAPVVDVTTSTASSTDVTLNWTVPTLNTDASPLTDIGGFNIYRKDDASGWAQVGTVIASATSFTDTPPAGELSSKNFQYYVTVFDTCPNPGPNESDRSNVYTECFNPPDCVFNVQASDDPLHPGDTINVGMTICTKQDGTPNSIVYMQICSDVGGSVIGPDADPIEMVEVGDSGFFEVNAATYGRTDIRLYDSATYPGTPINLDLEVDDTSDTVTVGAWSETAYSDSVCASGTFSCSEQTFLVVSSSCANVITPDAPTNVTVTPGGACNKSRKVSLTWDAPGNAPVTTYNVLRCSDASCSVKALIGQTSGTVFPEGSPSEYNVGAVLDTDDFTFIIQAANATCVTDVRQSLESTPAVDPCP